MNNDAHVKPRSWGFIYWNAPLYRTAMWMIRSHNERERMMRHVAQEVGTLSVLELCCGPGDFARALAGNTYCGIDKNPAFIECLRRRGMRAIQGDVLSTDWPSADCLVIIDSLYHFLDRSDALMEKIRLSSFRRIVVSEPVDNVVGRLPTWLKPLAGWATRVDGENCFRRYTETSLRDFFRLQGFQRIGRIGHNCIGVWEQR